ncbi:laccase domain-containing protein [Kribbella qitaiheensis]|uniref:Laccase domain-containing protein n=1 Tax=Kribbella qitaiheensis TaxID=1544730 RepID=A0A7G6X7E3_9ACTN|nr:polyphenol oxidase family protein [Kribbella qitaiheensis]QNE22158.1 laccase domain-containing protein [Kribbella qitaiheensis]
MFGYDEVLDGVRFAFTDRFGGASQSPYGELNLGSPAGEGEAPIAENYRRIAAEFGVVPDGVVRVSQVHGRDVVVIRPGDELPLRPMPHADALVTTRTDVALCVRAADCLPVLLADRVNGVVGAAHCGRRGMHAGVVPAAVEAMRELGAGRITAVLGPYACGKCYEVPAEMRAEVAERVPASYAETSWGTPSIDVAAGVVAQLAELDCEVVDVTSCTIESANLYSYRREGAVSGRMAGLVRLLP